MSVTPDRRTHIDALLEGDTPMSTNDLEALAAAVGVLTDPTSPEGIGTTITYLAGALLGAAPYVALIDWGWLA